MKNINENEFATENNCENNSNTGICTIYKLTNKENNKVYIGQTWLTLSKRMGKDGCNYKNSPYIYAALQKYGVEKFEYLILTQCYDQISADAYEDYYIDLFRSQDHDIGYNIKNGGSAGSPSQETRDKISNTLKNKVWSPEALEGKALGGLSWWGRKRGPQDKVRRERKAEEMVYWHANNPHPMQGKHHTEASKQSISKHLMGRKIDPESIKRGAEKRKMPKERENNIIADYLADILTSKELEAKYNTSSSSIYRVLDRNNVSRKNKKNK